MKKLLKKLLILCAAFLLSSCTVSVDAGGGSTPPSGGGETPPQDVKVTGISLDVTTLSLSLDETYQLVATVYPNNATNKTVSYASSNNVIATVNARGLVTAYNEGEARITATTKDGNYSAVCYLTVYHSQISVSEISIDKASLTLLEGE